MRYLSAADVSALGLSVERVEQIAERTLRGLDAGSVVMAPRPALQAGNGARFMAFPAVLEDERIAGVKWLGIMPSCAASGRRGLDACIALSAVDEGTLVALVDARWITAIRTAVVSLIAARRLARRESSRVAFIACGEQARYHLDLFASRFPIREIACWSRRLETAERFAAAARAMGYAAAAHGSLRDCVEGADIVLPSSPGATAALVEPDWLAPGCFISLVDLGRSMRTEGLSPHDILVVDDVEQFDSLRAGGALKRFGDARPLALAKLLQPAAGESRGEGSRTIFLPTGLGAIDIAMAWELVKTSQDKGIGTELRG